MKVKTYNERDLKKLLSQKPVNDSCNVFKVGYGVEKINKDILFDLQRFYHIMMPVAQIDEEQIKWLCEKQENISSTTLPNGVIYYEQYPIGVMYPRCYEGYKSFNELYKEDTKLFLENLKQSVIKNIELINNGIYNYDFTMSNILFKGEDVQLIDLDGKYISKCESVQRVYSYYMIGLINQIIKKIDSQYNKHEKELAIIELKAILSKIPSIPMQIDYPILILEEIQKAQILKR